MLLLLVRCSLLDVDFVSPIDCVCLWATSTSIPHIATENGLSQPLRGLIWNLKMNYSNSLSPESDVSTHTQHPHTHKRSVLPSVALEEVAISSHRVSNQFWSCAMDDTWFRSWSSMDFPSLSFCMIWWQKEKNAEFTLYSRCTSISIGWLATYIFN